jgi:shikimate kinase
MTRLLLVGMMGAGKTTVGRMVADRLDCPYVDSDEQVVRDTGQMVGQIFVNTGEAAFRAAESAALREVVSGAGPVVVSVAGGAVLDPANRALLHRSGTVVWLRATTATLAERVGNGEGRPLLARDPAGTLARLDQVRRPLYAEVADMVVDVDGVTPEVVAEQVLAVAGLG